MMSLDSIFNVIDASVPSLPVIAAAKLSSNDVQNGGLEGIEVVVWDLPALVLHLQMVKLLLESGWLVEGADGDVQAAQHTLGVGDEGRVGSVVTVHPLEEAAGLWHLRKGCSPDSLGEGFSVVSTAVGSSPLALHLQSLQDSALLLRQSDRNDSEQENQDLHFQDKFQPQGYNLN